MKKPVSSGICHRLEDGLPLVSLKEIYADAQANSYAVGQFNVSNLELVQAVLEAAQQLRAPVILGVSPSALKYAGLEHISCIVKVAAGKVDVPVVLHLDHGTSSDEAAQCITAGFTSVMIDGSHLSFQENVRVTAEVVNYAHRFGVTVEAELGRLAGIEDAINVSDAAASLTDPNQAADFVKATGCDALAVAVGTSHGAYKFKGQPRLDFDRIAEIKEAVGRPLVLHGASGVPLSLIEEINKYGGRIEGARGLPEEAYRLAIKAGINKINIDTDLRLAFTAAVRRFLTEKPNEFDPRKILGPAREAVAEVVRQRIALFGGAGRW